MLFCARPNDEILLQFMDAQILRCCLRVVKLIFHLKCGILVRASLMARWEVRDISVIGRRLLWDALEGITVSVFLLRILFLLALILGRS